MNRENKKQGNKKGKNKQTLRRHMNIRSHEDFKLQCRMSIDDTETNDLVTSQVLEEAQVESNEMDRREKAGHGIVWCWGDWWRKQVLMGNFLCNKDDESLSGGIQSVSKRKKINKNTTHLSCANKQRRANTKLVCVCVLLFV